MAVTTPLVWGWDCSSVLAPLSWGWDYGEGAVSELSALGYYQFQTCSAISEETSLVSLAGPWTLALVVKPATIGTGYLWSMAADADNGHGIARGVAEGSVVIYSTDAGGATTSDEIEVSRTDWQWLILTHDGTDLTLHVGSTSKTLTAEGATGTPLVALAGWASGGGEATDVSVAAHLMWDEALSAARISAVTTALKEILKYKDVE